MTKKQFYPTITPHYDVVLNPTTVFRVYLTEASIMGSVKNAYLAGLAEGELKTKEKRNG
jgi:hypothetical protein